MNWPHNSLNCECHLKLLTKKLYLNPITAIQSLLFSMIKNIGPPVSQGLFVFFQSVRFLLYVSNFICKPSVFFYLFWNIT